jgi:anti-sigma factor RsiW
MTTHEGGHIVDALDEHLDGRLTGEELAAADSHLALCAECRSKREALARVRETLRARGESAHAGLREQIEGAIARDSASPASSRRRLAAAAALIAAALLAFALLWPARSADVPGQAAQALTRVEDGRVQIARVTADAAELEAYFREARPDHVTRVFDLGMMGWRLQGGSPSSLGEEPSSLFVYTDAKGRRLLCQMYGGRWEDLPAPEAVHREKGFTFHVYRRGDTILVFWREAGAICVLTGRIPENEILALAVAKAS